MLNARLKAQYETDGYLVVPDFKSRDDIARLRGRALEIVAERDEDDRREVFAVDERTRRRSDYFLASANTVRCFFEEDAFDSHGNLIRATEESVNKIGHAMHDLDPLFDRFSRTSDLAELAAGIGIAQPQIWQSMYIFKQPRIGGEVRWHQDASYFYTEPITVTTFWFALQDATVDNGCLWVEPGGHQSPLREVFVVENGESRLTVLDDTPWPKQESAVPVEVSAGTLVVFHGLLPHYSAPNRSAKSRHAYTMHVTDGASRYSAKNWIQRTTEFPVRGFEALRD